MRFFPYADEKTAVVETVSAADLKRNGLARTHRRDNGGHMSLPRRKN